MTQFLNKLRIYLLAVCAVALLFAGNAEGQRARFPDLFSNQNNVAPQFPQVNLPALPGTIQNPTIITTPDLGVPPATLQLPQLGTNNGVIPGGVVQGGVIPGGIVQSPVFQAPFSVPQPTNGGFNPTQTGNQPFPIFPKATQPGFQEVPANVAPSIQFPGNGQPVFPGNQPGFQGYPSLPQNAYGSQQIPNRWPYEGTGTNWLPSVDWTWPQEAWRSFRTQFLPRVLERPRARQTYLYGNNGNELNINDLEIATTATIPNFLRGPTPLRVSPGFVFHWWDGPDSNVFPAFDLPARAYSTYLAFDHITNPANNSGLETNFTIGYYSDFDNTSSDAIRMTSKLLGWQRLNPYTIGKLGIEYLDRVDVKLLPAVGVYMTPNPDLKLDLYFPKPKLSHRIPNFGDFEAWMYVGGEYGGGSWAIERRNGTLDQADINDVRAFIGMEWMGPRRVTGFFEFGYAFDREIVYRSNALNVLDLQDTLMLRSGLAF